MVQERQGELKESKEISGRKPPHHRPSVPEVLTAAKSVNVTAQRASERGCARGSWDFLEGLYLIAKINLVLRGI